MIEVTRKNFTEMMPQIEWAIREADFVAIDTEFTGLYLNEHCKPSLFDSSKERYHKLKNSVESFTVAQIGITTFTGDIQNNKYDAKSFSFYLCPASFGSVDPRFSLQASSIQFLSSHTFDFNKCFTEGVPYLNKDQEESIRQGLESDDGLNSEDDLKEVQRICSCVASWMCRGNGGNFLTLNLDQYSFLSAYKVQNQIRKRFPNATTSINKFNQIVVEKVPVGNDTDRFRHHQRWKQGQDQRLVKELLGFTNVFRLLVQCQKPLVGHNLLMDLLFIFSKFHTALPDTYEEFKRQTHKLFPLIFDTKHLHYYLKEKLKSLNLKIAYSLETLDRILKSQTIIELTRLQPSIQRQGQGQKEKSIDTPHHAGYDSFLCGCVFIRISHLEHFKDNSELVTTVCPFTFQSYLSTIGRHANHINIIRASTNHTRLDGVDPVCKRPPLLYVSYVGDKEKTIPHEFASRLSKYGVVDIKMVTPTQALVATSHFMIARDILYSFQGHPSIRVTRYKFHLHSRLGKTLWWTIFTSTFGCSLMFIYKVLK